MTLADVQARVSEVRAEADDNDDEAAHGSEDLLWEDVLKAIAGGAQNAAELAGAALLTNDIDFSRWCA